MGLNERERKFVFNLAQKGRDHKAHMACPICKGIDLSSELEAWKGAARSWAATVRQMERDIETRPQMNEEEKARKYEDIRQNNALIDKLKKEVEQANKLLIDARAENEMLRFKLKGN